MINAASLVNILSAEIYPAQYFDEQTCHTSRKWVAYHLKMNCAIKLFSVGQVVTSNDTLNRSLSELPHHFCTTDATINSDLLCTLYCCAWDTFMHILLDQRKVCSIISSLVYLLKGPVTFKLSFGRHLSQEYLPFTYHC